MSSLFSLFSWALIIISEKIKYKTRQPVGLSQYDSYKKHKENMESWSYAAKHFLKKNQTKTTTKP